jgi:FkbM family methyltransferase
VKKLLSWLVKQSEGTSFTDSILLFFLKILYFGLRILLRVVLGRRRRDRLYVERELDFGVFWYKFFKMMRKGNASKLSRFHVPKYGYEFYCRLNKDDFKLMALHEDEILDQFDPRPGDTVVDVGAHIGLYTLIAAKRVGPGGKVIAIEPDPENFKILKKNILLNQLSNVKALGCAVYSTKEKLKLFLPQLEQGRTIFNTVMQDRARTSNNFLEVEANTLDNILESINITEVNWIKIDVEGAELEVLKGAVNTISSNKNITLIIEIHGIEIYIQMIEYLKAHNLRIMYEKSNEKGDWRHIIAKNLAPRAQ